MSFASWRSTLGAAFVFGAIGAGPAFAQAPYPNQRVLMYIGFAAGGYADSVARVIGARLGERLGQTFQAQNLEGGGGISAARQVTIAPPDGYTLLVTTTSLAINETYVPGRGYTVDRLAAVAMPVSAPESMTANNASGIKTIADMVAMAKAGKVYLGTPGIGSSSHIAAEFFFKTLAKAEVKLIPFQGGSPATLGLIAGDINVMAATASGGPVRNVASGDITGIGVETRERTSILPNVPTFAESGYPGFEASAWVGFFAPAGTPTAVLDKLNREINAVVQEDETKERLKALSADIFIRDRVSTQSFLAGEIANWSKMVEAVGTAQ